MYEKKKNKTGPYRKEGTQTIGEKSTSSVYIKQLQDDTCPAETITTGRYQAS